ncbi:HSF-type DNA-binding domain-containing protein [Rhizoctonia solani AG-1 IA]|uniref:HSF-type DNA-binding domain-containing protein n=1 Tax=Thanatephorus cucumeris (strain AG1-IA) TaxID=983506 RepID=L8WZ52_THACA|nr:HSF-type DNA-binding domain-containing protein [Rhizoctonia solani AG-1 IA]
MVSQGLFGLLRVPILTSGSTNRLRVPCSRPASARQPTLNDSKHVTCMLDILPRTMSSYSPTQQSQIYPPALPQQSQQPPHSQSPEEHDDGDATPPKSADSQKLETKPQATFLTKLYALLERPEYQSMIRWDAAGEQIIVERPEQLALHVLPSIYRQSRFTDLCAKSTYAMLIQPLTIPMRAPAHPTLNRNSPPEVVANFKRRVPPRLPKPRKRDQIDISRVGPGSLAPGLTVPSSTHPMSLGMVQGKPRTRGFSAPSLPFGFAGTAHLQPAGQPQPYYNVAPPQKWGGSYGTSLPPLTVPGEHGYGPSYGRHMDDPHAPHYGHSSQYPPHHSSQQLPVLRDPAFQYPGYGTGAPGSGADTSSWSFLPPASSLTSSHSGSLSSLLNPSANSGSYARPPSSGGFAHGSPDSRPNTGYSVASSVSSIGGGGYDGGEQNPFALRPTTVGGRDESGRPLTPTSAGGVRPGSSKGNPPGASSLTRILAPTARTIPRLVLGRGLLLTIIWDPSEVEAWPSHMAPSTTVRLLQNSPTLHLARALTMASGWDNVVFDPAHRHRPCRVIRQHPTRPSTHHRGLTTTVSLRLHRQAGMAQQARSAHQKTCRVSSDLNYFGMTDGGKPPIHA